MRARGPGSGARVPGFQGPVQQNPWGPPLDSPAVKRSRGRPRKDEVALKLDEWIAHRVVFSISFLTCDKNKTVLKNISCMKLLPRAPAQGQGCSGNGIEILISHGPSHHVRHRVLHT